MVIECAAGVACMSTGLLRFSTVTLCVCNEMESNIITTTKISALALALYYSRRRRAIKSPSALGAGLDFIACVYCTDDCWISAAAGQDIVRPGSMVSQQVGTRMRRASLDERTVPERLTGR